MSLWYPARAPRASVTSSKPVYRHFISVAKIVEVLQGTQLPDALGWEFQLEAGKSAFWHILYVYSAFFLGGGLEVEGVDVQIIMVMYLLEYVLVCVVLFGGLGPVDECVL